APRHRFSGAPGQGLRAAHHRGGAERRRAHRAARADDEPARPCGAPRPRRLGADQARQRGCPGVARVIVAGVDGGGTKTAAVVCDGGGRVLGYARAGTGNWEIVGVDGALAAVTGALDGALAAADLGRDDLEAAAFALAGVDWPSDIGMLEPLL